MSAEIKVSCIPMGPTWVSVLELATRNMFKLYFGRLLSYKVWVCGRVAFFGT